MAKPRIFISSTFYDLRHIRTDLERFILEMGYDPVRNENGDIPYGVDQNLEEYCYKEVKEVDILIGIIGSRFGSDSKEEKHSITQLEIKTAYDQGKQVYLFIDKNVYSEYQTYLINKPQSIKYKYVDNIKIYEFVEEIMAIKAGIIIQPFEHVIEITSYLKLQWAGLMRDLLRQRAENQQLIKLGTKIEDLEILTESLKSYMEKSLPEFLSDKEGAKNYIQHENSVIDERKIINRLSKIPYINHIIKSHSINLDILKDGLVSTNTLDEFIKYLKDKQEVPDEFYCLNESGIDDINEARELLRKPIFDVKSFRNVKSNYYNINFNKKSNYLHDNDKSLE